MKLKERASRFRDFLDANNERATKAFCRLSKEGGLCDDLTQIKDKDGNNFSNDKDRVEHIKGFYETLYKKKMDAILSIEDFLGNEIANVEWVNDRKLTDEERETLEGPVTLLELKDALDNSNFDSTSGWDGVSFKVIRKFWNSLKHPMIMMVNETFDNGELMESFKLGVIKIIPKKGDAGKIEDWRPITLLCCGYKIISGVVAKRLEKYLTKIIGRAQKGFMKQKNIHTCTANIITCIAQANANNEGMGVMCVDFKKAFDSVEHVTIRRVLEFFNYGGVMVNMVMTLLHGRMASIITGTGFSGRFGIGRGTPQGDRSSPYIFIIVMEILLMKIRLMEGRGVECCDFIMRAIEGIDIETITAEAYADDLTILFKMSEINVREILTMLERFFRTTGLEINTEKTQLMIAGSEQWRVGLLIQGIRVVSNVKVLGIKIDRKLEKINDNWEDVITKMRRLAGYWGIFGLSIAGRVMVAKTYIVSQILFTMGILPLSEELCNRLNEIVVSFVSGTGRPIERRRQFLRVEDGGYGMMNMRTMNVCLKSLWIRRINDMMINGDYIGVTVIGSEGFQEMNFDYERIGNGSWNRVIGPVAEDIVENWRNFKREFYRIGHNIVEAKLFENIGLENENRGVETLVFGGRYGEVRNAIKDKTIRDLTDNQLSLKEKIVIENECGIRIGWAEYFRLRTAVRGVIDRRDVEDDGTVKIGDFMDRGKLRCKKLRMIYDGRRSRNHKENNPNRIASLHTLWGARIEQKDRKYIEWNLRVWSISVLEAQFKDFCFKLLHGRLYLNLALSHFTDTRPGCTFCKIVKKKELSERGINEGTVQFNLELEQIENETVEHLLWECGVTKRSVTGVLNRLTGNDGMRVNRERYMEGTETDNKVDDTMVIIVCRYIQFLIYNCRLRVKTPSVVYVLEELQGFVGRMQKYERWRGTIRRVPLLMNRVLVEN